MKFKLTPSVLKILLIVTLIVTIGLGIGGFYLAQKQLTSYANAISQLNADALAGDSNIEDLLRIESYLAGHQDTILKAQKIVSESKSYAYQDQIIEELVEIGKSANIKITAFGFNTAAADTGATPAAPDGAPPTSTEPTAISDVKSTTANVTFDSTVNYNDLMKFIKAIELNPTKMQIESVSLAKSEGNNVTTPAFSIEVYIR